MTKTSSPLHKTTLDQIDAICDQMAEGCVRLANDTLAYSVSLANQWRKLGLDAARKAIDKIDVNTAA